MQQKFIEHIKKFIADNALILPGDSLLVAVSGGADSVCLLDVLFTLKDELSITLSAAHVNHMLRGPESDRDEQFVRSLCDQYRISLFCERIDVARLAKGKNLSCEEAGRYARYEFFHRLKTEYHFDKIATAHNQNDNVETVLMRFLRGTGITGLGGIPIYNSRGVIRPLLSIPRCEIERYLNEKGISYIVDSSNLEDRFTRNKIRNQLLPDIVRAYNPNFIDTMGANIALYRETASFCSRCIDAAFAQLAQRDRFGYIFRISYLLDKDAFILKGLIKKAVFELSGHVITNNSLRTISDAVLSKENFTYTVTSSLTVYIKYRSLFFVQKKAVLPYCYENVGLQSIKIDETGHFVSFASGCGNVSFQDKHVIFIKKSLCKNATFSIRNRRAGDRIFLGACGHKKVKDILIDEKVPAFLRDEIPLLLLNGKIIWVFGLRDDPSFRAQSGEAYIKIRYDKEKKDE